MASASFLVDDFHTHDKTLETFHLVWLDDYKNNNEERQNIQKQLRTAINHLKTFDEVCECQKYIEEISKQDRVILIVSGRLGLEVVPHIHELRQVSSIYIYSMKETENEQWTETFSKIKAVGDHPDELISRIISNHKIQKKVDEPLGIDILTTRGEDGQSTIGLNGQFIHFQQLMDVLLRMKSRPTDKSEFYTLCAEEYSDNAAQLAILKEYQKSYTPDKALWWYTRDSFLYRMLNKALRVQNINILFLLRSFIRHIYKKLKHYQCLSRIQVYRGQLMSTDELSTLEHSIGELISINSFLSTSTDREIARSFLGDRSPSDDLQRVLFEIDANPLVLGHYTRRPFANISACSNFVNESEVLFMLSSIFRLNDIQRDHNGVLVIRMALCSDDDNDVKQLLERMKKGTKPDIRSLGDVLKDMGKFELAEKYFSRVLNELPLNDPSRGFLYYSLSAIYESKSVNDISLYWLEQAIEAFKQNESSDYFNTVQLNNLIGETHRLKGNYNEALESYNKALSIYRSLEKGNDKKIGMIYGNISLIYQAQKKYLEALAIEEECLSSRLKYLPSHHPELGLSYTNLGIIHSCLGHHDIALEMLQKSLKIKVKALPPHHPDIGMTYQHLGLIYETKNELPIASTYLQTALSIYCQELPLHHPNIIKCEQDIQRLRAKLE